MPCAPAEDARMWRTAEGVHLDLRDLSADEAVSAILAAIDAGEIDGALIAHVDSEPIMLYAELEERGWSHDFVEHHHAGPGERHCDGSLQLRLVRWGAA